MIHDLDVVRRIRMSQDGKRPMNPYFDDAAYDEALRVKSHPVSGHQGPLMMMMMMMMIVIMMMMMIMMPSAGSACRRTGSGR
jgi:hypothetical protein